MHLPAATTVVLFRRAAALVCRVRSTSGAKFAPALAALACVAVPALAASPIGSMTLPPGFRVELVYEVPLEAQGSWVALTVDARGRLIASDQNGALYRIEPSPLGEPATATRVEPIRLQIGKAQGLIAVGDDLYVMLNGQIGSFSSGIYRLTDDDGDDQYDMARQVRVLQGGGEHGPHGFALAPDGKSLYFCCGNATSLPHFERSRVPRAWGEDQLLPRLYDPRGHASSLVAPGGFVAKLDLQDDSLELVSVGYRNPYDLAVNDEGELFTFDADMEWDIGASWYRPTRVCHAVSGSDFGWRSGNGKWPEYYVDSVPAAVDCGPGSPTGITFGNGLKFPPKYQRALFVGDWSYGRIMAVELEPHQSSYRGTVEPFAGAAPLGVTDLAVRPQDGALYFTVGGRQSLSGLYRIVWDPEAAGAAASDAPASDVSEAAPDAVAADGDLAAKLRAYRRRLETLHLQRAEAVKTFPLLGHADPFIRHAARIVLEQTPPDQWLEAVAEQSNPLVRCTALAAAARHGASELEPRWSELLAATSFAELSPELRLVWLRTSALGVIRWEPIGEATWERLINALDAHFPTGHHAVDRELAHLLIRLQASELPPRLLAWLEAAATREEAIDAIVALSAAPGPWTLDQRIAVLDWFEEAARDAGGMSSFGYLTAARDRFIRGFTPEEVEQLAVRVARPLAEAPAQLESAQRPFVKEWTRDEVVALVEQATGPRDFARGRRMFAAASCFQCHRLAGSGSALGPDLNGVGRRFGVADLVRSIVEPNHEISDQFQQMIFSVNGRLIAGRISNINQDLVSISTNPLDPKTAIGVRRDEIDDQYPSDVSMMPAGLLNTLTAEEIVDLLAYLRAGGDPEHELYRPSSP